MARESVQTGFGTMLLSIMMLGVFLLGGGGAWLVAKRGETKKGLLMLVAALVLLGNVLIWTL